MVEKLEPSQIISGMNFMPAWKHAIMIIHHADLGSFLLARMRFYLLQRNVARKNYSPNGPSESSLRSEPGLLFAAEPEILAQVWSLGSCVGKFKYSFKGCANDSFGRFPWTLHMLTSVLITRRREMRCSWWFGCFRIIARFIPMDQTPLFSLCRVRSLWVAVVMTHLLRLPSISSMGSCTPTNAHWLPRACSIKFMDVRICKGTCTHQWAIIRAVYQQRAGAATGAGWAYTVELGGKVL